MPGSLQTSPVQVTGVPALKTPEKQAAIEQRIKEVHGQIASGKLPFADAALKYSEDESSNTKGGELPMFGTGKMIEEFEDAAFALNNDGDLSAPIKSRYGWHIIKLIEKKPLGTSQIASFLKNHLEAQGVAVVMESQHTCMSSRGVREHNASMTTSEMRGSFLAAPSARQEFLDLIRK